MPQFFEDNEERAWYDEANRRGLLSGDEKAWYDEAIKRESSPQTNTEEYGAEKKEDPSWGETLSGAVKNFAPSTKKAVSDFGEAIMHPIDTLGNIGSVAKGGLETLARSATPENFEGEEPSEDMRKWKAVSDFYSDRYGSGAGFKKALRDDPAGVLSDAASVLTGVGGAVKGAVGAGSKVGKLANIASAAGKALDPMTVPMAVAGKGANLAGKVVKPIASATARVLRPQTSREIMGSLVKPTTTLNPLERQQLLDLMLQERLKPTAEGYKDFVDLKTRLGDEIGDNLRAYSQEQALGTKPMFDMGDINEQARLNAIDRFEGGWNDNSIIGDINSHAKKADMRYLQGSPLVGPNGQNIVANMDMDAVGLDKAKRASQAMVNYDKDGKLGAAGEFSRAHANAANDALRQAVPEYAKLNDKLHLLHGLDEVLPRAANRIDNNTALGGAAGNTSFKTGLGGFIGGVPGATVGFVKGLIDRDPNLRAEKAFARYADEQRRARGQFTRLEKTGRAISKGAGLVGKFANGARKKVGGTKGRSAQYQAGRMKNTTDDNE